MMTEIQYKDGPVSAILLKLKKYEGAIEEYTYELNFHLQCFLNCLTSANTTSFQFSKKTRNRIDLVYQKALEEFEISKSYFDEVIKSYNVNDDVTVSEYVKGSVIPNAFREVQEEMNKCKSRYNDIYALIKNLSRIQNGEFHIYVE